MIVANGLAMLSANINNKFNKMTEEKINELALSKYPIDEFWIGDLATGRMYDQNARDRAVFIKGMKAVLSIGVVRLSFVDWVGENYPTLKNHGDSLTLSELRTAYDKYTNEA